MKNLSKDTNKKKIYKIFEFLYHYKKYFVTIQICTDQLLIGFTHTYLKSNNTNYNSKLVFQILI